MKCIIVIVIYGFEALKVSFQTGKNFRWSNTCNICMIRKHSKKKVYRQELTNVIVVFSNMALVNYVASKKKIVFIP